MPVDEWNTYSPIHALQRRCRLNLGFHIYCCGSARFALGFSVFFREHKANDSARDETSTGATV